MNRIEDEPEAPVAAAVAWRILDALGASPETHDPDVLAHVARFLENIGALFAFAAREGLCLEWGPQERHAPTENLQFYFDVSRGGWDDPGIRVGDLLKVPGGPGAGRLQWRRLPDS